MSTRWAPFLRGEDKNVKKKSQSLDFIQIKYPNKKPLKKKTKIKQHGKYSHKPLNELEQAI